MVIDRQSGSRDGLCSVWEAEPGPGAEQGAGGAEVLGQWHMLAAVHPKSGFISDGTDEW